MLKSHHNATFDRPVPITEFVYKVMCYIRMGRENQPPGISVKPDKLLNFGSIHDAIRQNESEVAQRQLLVVKAIFIDNFFFFFFFFFYVRAYLGINSMKLNQMA